jgi:iron complex outermembrane receptor protein
MSFPKPGALRGAWLGAAAPAALLLALAASGAARAEDAPRDPGVLIDSVIVTANPNPEDPPAVAEARARLSRTPGAVSVVSAESYEKRFAAGLDDVLRDAPGVYVQKKWGGDMRLSIRGSGIGNNAHNRGVLTSIDGLPFNEADGFGDTQLIDPLNARYAEVYRGGNALRFGGAVLGGAVNFVTPTGETAGFDTRIRVDGGSFGTLRQNLSAARVVGDWDGVVSLTNMTGQGYRSQTQQNVQFGALNVGRGFGQDREVRFYLFGANVQQEIPGALTLAQAMRDPEQANAANLANDYGRNQRSLRGAVRTRWRFNDQLVFEGGVYAIWKELDHPIFQVIDQESRNYGLFGRLDWEGEVAGVRADLFAGVWLRKGDLDAKQFINVRGAPKARMAYSHQNGEAADLFAEGRLFVTPNLAITAGGAFGWAGRDYELFKQPANPASFNLKTGKDFDWFAPRLGILWESDSGAQVFANLTRSVEPPNFSSLSPTAGGFSPLEPQKAWTGEVGARGRAGAFAWDVTLYRAQLEDELLVFTVDPTHPAATFNADDTIHQGLEAALDWQFAEGWRLRQSLTWSDFRFDGDPQYGDNRLPVVPETLYRAELRYQSAGGWFVAPSLEWAPKGPYVDFRNTTRAPDYAILSLNAGWRLDNGVSLFADVRNLTDETWISNVNSVVLATPATAAFWPGDGRSLFVGLTVDF